MLFYWTFYSSNKSWKFSFAIKGFHYILEIYYRKQLYSIEKYVTILPFLLYFSNHIEGEHERHISKPITEPLPNFTAWIYYIDSPSIFIFSLQIIRL